MMRRAAVPLVLFAIVLLVRAALVATFASPTPYWDQWDAEGGRLLLPWLQGELRVADLFTAHNEHRILWTRLLTLALFELNGGQWDNLVAALANTALVAATAAVLYAVLRDGLRTRAARAGLFAAVLAVTALPFGWENLLTGFQSQFYLMTLAAIVLAWLAARLRDGAWAGLAALWVLAVAAMFTMASGFLGAAAAGGVLMLRAAVGALSPRFAAVAVAALAVPSLLSLLSVPSLPGHAALHAAGVGEWVAALGRLLGWPLGGWPWAGVLWLPTAWAAADLARRRALDTPAAVALGLAGWALLQAAGIAYSRGHGMEAPSVRYTDTLALGIAANAWFALRAAERAFAAWRGRSGPATSAAAPPAVSAAWALLLVAPLAAGTVLVRNAPGHVAILADEARHARLQTGNVRAYLEEGDARRLHAPRRELPYPSAERLQGRLDAPALRAALPWNLVDPRADGRVDAGPLSQVAFGLQRSAQRAWLHDEIGLPPGERAALAARGDGAAEALWLADGARLDVRLRAPHDGVVRRLGLYLATGGQPVTGTLTVRLCGRGCTTASAPLDGARDNADLIFAFPAPLPVAGGEGLRLRLVARVDGAPVAVWLLPGAPNQPAPVIRERGRPRDLPGRTPRVAFGMDR